MSDSATSPTALTAVTVSSYRQGIRTQYRGPATRRGARVIASAEAGRVTVPWDYALNADENHAAACREFATRWGWGGRWVGATLPDGSRAWVDVTHLPEGGTL